MSIKIIAIVIGIILVVSLIGYVVVSASSLFSGISDIFGLISNPEKDEKIVEEGIKEDKVIDKKLIDKDKEAGEKIKDDTPKVAEKTKDAGKKTEKAIKKIPKLG